MDRRGFSMMELIVVLAVALVLFALLAPGVQAARESARLVTCRSNLRQIGLALHTYHDQAGRLPFGTIWTSFQYDAPRTNYVPALLPGLDQAALFNRLDWSVGGTLWCNPANAEVVRTVIPGLFCPSDGLGGRTKMNGRCGEHAMTNYMAVFGRRMADVYSTQAPFGANRQTRWGDVKDGLSQTALFGEYLTGTPEDLRGGLWGDETAMSLLFLGWPPNHPNPDLIYPNPRLCDPQNPRQNDPSRNMPCGLGDGYTTDTTAARSRHAGGAHLLFADGSVRLVAESIDLTTWQGFALLDDEAAREFEP